MSAGRVPRLSCKRKNVDLQCVPGSSVHDVSDDFQEAPTVFRLPKKKLRSERASSPPRLRGRPRKEETKNAKQRVKISSTEDKPPHLQADRDAFDDQSLMSYLESGKQTVDTQEVVADVDISLIDLEKSICSESEKLCPSCKHIVPCTMFFDHFKECLQKFRLTKRGLESNSMTTPSDINSDDQEKAKVEGQQEENQKMLPCPVCMKPQKSKIQLHSHMENCAQTQGLTSEEILMASREIEKKAVERNQLEPPLLMQQTDATNDRGTEKIERKVKKSAKGIIKAVNADPDLAMALALSRSAAEEEAATRAIREEKLLALGLSQIVDEDRKAKPIFFPPPEADNQQTVASQSRRKGRKRPGNFQKSTLATRSVEERERLVSEKVAGILASEDAPSVSWENTASSGAKGRLSKFKNEGCILWEAAHRCIDQCLEEFYVPELEPYIKPKKAAVGGLLRSLSQIPGRLNMTSLRAISDENSDTGSECEEASVVDEYCTQLALAELLGSQDCLEHTCADISLGVDQAIPRDLESASDPSMILEAGSGFWRVHSTENRENGDRSLKKDDENYDNTHKGIRNGDCGETSKITVGGILNESSKEYGCSMNPFVNKGNDSNDNTQNDNLGDILVGDRVQENIPLLDEDIKEIGSEKNEINILGSSSEESRIQSDKDILKVDSHHTWPSPSIKFQKTDIVDNVSTGNKCQEDYFKDNHDPDIIMAKFKRKSSHHSKSQADSDCQVLATSNNISECLSSTQLENAPITCRNLLSVCNSPEILPMLQLKLSSDEEEGFIKSVEDENSNASGHSDESIITQVFLRDDSQTSCSENLLNDNTVLYTENELPSSCADNGSRQKNGDKRKEIFFSSDSQNNAAGKKTNTNFNLDEGIKKSFQNDCRKMDLVSLQNCDSNEAQQLQLKQTCKSNLITFFDGESGMNSNRAKEDGAETAHNLEAIKLSHYKLGSTLENQAKHKESKAMQDKLTYDMCKLLLSKEESDVSFTLSDGTVISAHSLIFLARCPQLYKEMKDKQMQVLWDGVSFEGAQTFLAYLYTGTCEIKAKDSPLWMDVFDLALKYECTDLVSYLESLYKACTSPVKAISLIHTSNSSQPMANIFSSKADSQFTPRRLSDGQDKNGENWRTAKTPEGVISLTNKSTWGNSPTDDNFQLERVMNTQIEQGSHSPDIFDESVHVRDVSFVSTPADSPPMPVTSDQSPCLEGAAAVHLKSSSSNVLGPEKDSLCKPDTSTQESQSSIHVSKSNVKASTDIESLSISQKVKNDKKRCEQEQNDHCRSASEEETCGSLSEKCNFVHQSEFNEHLEADKDNLTDYPKSRENMEYPVVEENNMNSPKADEEIIIDCPEVDDHNMNNTPEVAEDMIDLTLSSSDDTSETCTSDTVSWTSGRINTPDLGPAEIGKELLNLWGCEKHPERNKRSNQQEQAVVSVPDSPDQNLTGHGSPDMEQQNANEQSVCNIWEDFDNVGCAMSDFTDVCPTPSKNSDVTDTSVCTNDTVSLTSGRINTNDLGPAENDMELLNLWESGKSRERNKRTNQQQQDIVCAPDSPIQNLTEHKSPDMEQENAKEQPVSNIWEDFDDVNCAMSIPIDVCPTPSKNLGVTETNVYTIDDDNLSRLGQFPQKIIDKHSSISIKSYDLDVSLVHCEPGSGTPRELSVKGSSTRKPSENVDIITASTKFKDSSSKVDKEKLKGTKEVASGSSVSDETLAQLTEDLEDSLLWKDFEQEDVESFKQTSLKNNKSENCTESVPVVMTPQAKKTSSSITVTPLPDYKNMSSPDLKKELTKYGVRPLGRRKAVVLLQHIYEETHPLVTDSEADSSFCDTPEQKAPLRPSLDMKSKAIVQEKIMTRSGKLTTAARVNQVNKKVIGLRTKNATVTPSIAERRDSDEDADEESSQFNSSQMSTTSTEGFESECQEELTGSDEEDIITPTQQVDLASQVVQFITSDPEFHQKVLLYEPFFIEELLASLKANGVKCNMKNLRDILDDQSITFRTQQGQRNRERSRKGRRWRSKSPRKWRRWRSKSPRK